MIKLFDGLGQGSTEISDRITEIKAKGPFVVVSVDVRGGRRDNDGDIVLPPKRLGSETAEEFKQRLNLFYNVTEPITDPHVRCNVLTNEIEFPPYPADGEDENSEGHKNALAAYEASTVPVLVNIHRNTHDLPSALETWKVLLKLAKAKVDDDSCASAEGLELQYRQAIYDVMTYMSEKFPESRKHFELERQVMIRTLDEAK